jgi:hypothetical protein
MITARDLQEPQDHINNGGYHIIVCTSSTRPGSPVDGQHIYETDTDKTLSWDGTSWNPVSGAASYQPGEPANPSVGSLWVDSDETASQLNTNDFLLKADASAASGYVSKVGGDTVVASGAAVKPLVLKGASSQTANLQEWQDSTGAVVASVSPTGNIVGGGLTLVKKQTIGTGVSSVNVTGAFSATYQAYKIIIAGGVGSTNQAISLKMGSAANGHDSALIYVAYAGSAVLTDTYSNSATWPLVGYSTTSGLSMNVDLVNPFLTSVTRFITNFSDQSNTGTYNGRHNSTTSFTDFTVAVAGTMTGGTIYVYGYGTN